MEPSFLLGEEVEAFDATVLELCQRWKIGRRFGLEGEEVVGGGGGFGVDFDGSRFGRGDGVVVVEG